MKIEELMRDTDALTYVNSLKVTLAELKAEFSTIEELHEYISQATERARKLIRRADNQYRMIAKLAQRENSPITEVEINEELLGLEELMSSE